MADQPKMYTGASPEVAAASYPAAAKPAYDAQVLNAPAQTHSEAEAAELEAMYARLRPEAIEEARKYVLARTPPQYQQDMIDLIAADFAPPEPPVADPAARAADEPTVAEPRPVV